MSLYKVSLKQVFLFQKLDDCKIFKAFPYTHAHTYIHVSVSTNSSNASMVALVHLSQNEDSVLNVCIDQDT